MSQPQKNRHHIHERSGLERGRGGQLILRPYCNGSYDVSKVLFTEYQHHYFTFSSPYATMGSVFF